MSGDVRRNRVLLFDVVLVHGELVDECINGRAGLLGLLGEWGQDGLRDEVENMGDAADVALPAAEVV